MEPAANFSLQDSIYRLLQESPELRRCIDEMVREEESQLASPEEYWLGWEWEDVHTSAPTINALIGMGIVSVSNKSRTHRNYLLTSLQDTKEALSMSTSQLARSYGPIEVDQLFKMVFGHEDVKLALRLAIAATAPVHCLLIGPPGTAKTLMLEDIGRLPGAYCTSGPTISKSGLVGMLLQQRPRFLTIEELDKMGLDEMAPLLQLMEGGIVSRLIHGAHERITLGTKVFADCNDVRRINQMILSRFAKKEIPPYSQGEFVQVAANVLQHREGLGPNMSDLIANEVVRYSTDIRDAVRVARMARNDPRLVADVVRVLWAGRQRAPVTPIGGRR